MNRPDPASAEAAPATPLARAIPAILESERAYPPKSIAKVTENLRVTGFGFGASPAEIETALRELLAAGKVERIWRRGVAHYRALARKHAVTGAM